MNVLFEFIVRAFRFLYNIVNLSNTVDKLKSSWFYLETQLLELKDAILEIRLDNIQIKQDFKDLTKRVDNIEETLGITKKAKRNARRKH